MRRRVVSYECKHANIIFTMHDWFVLFLPIGGIIIVAMYKACKMLENKGHGQYYFVNKK